MAVRRSRAASGLLLSLALLGVVGAQGSGSHGRTEQPHAPVVEPPAAADAEVPPAVLDALEWRDAPGPVALPEIPEVPDVLAVEHVVPAATAPAPTTVSSVDDPLVQATLAAIAYPWQDRLRGWVVSFGPPRAGVRGMTYPQMRRIEIYVRADDSSAELARVLAHELGHAVDVTFNDALDRERWRRARGIDQSVPWWPGESAADFASVAGDFAEAFAQWQTGVTSESVVAGAPTADQLAVLASLAS